MVSQRTGDESGAWRVIFGRQSGSFRFHADRA